MKAFIALLLISSCQSLKFKTTSILSNLNKYIPSNIIFEHLKEQKLLQLDDKETWENSGWITPYDNGLGDEEVIGSFDPKNKKKEKCKEKESKKVKKSKKKDNSLKDEKKAQQDTDPKSPANMMKDTEDDEMEKDIKIIKEEKEDINDLKNKNKSATKTEKMPKEEVPVKEKEESKKEEKTTKPEDKKEKVKVDEELPTAIKKE